MEVSWEHPKAQRPENGYRLVFAPFADVIDQKPWIEVVDGDTNTVSFIIQKTPLTIRVCISFFGL